MGIKNLHSWIKRTKPEVIQAFPDRWAHPSFKGKRVAIDGTLLTNRYHFSPNDKKDGGATSIIGWYRLITEMKTNGIKPIAIWDQPGVRTWKAAEAKKRLDQRACQLARRNHELVRAARLGLLEDAINNFATLPEAEKESVRAHWRETKFTVETPAAASAPQDSTGQTIVEEPLPEIKGEVIPGIEEAPSVDRITSTIDTLTHLVQAYRSAYRPTFSTKTTTLPFGITQPLGLNSHIVDEALAQEEWTERNAQGKSESGLWKEELEEVGASWEGLAPLLTYTETPRQAELSQQEGEIFNDLLSTPSSSTPPSERLAALIKDQPAVLAMYTKALDRPTASSHSSVQTLLRLMGVPVIIAPIPYEAEGLASALQKAGKVDWVGTEDSDVLAYRAKLLRGLSPSRLPIAAIDGEGLRSTLGLSEKEYLDCLILMGTDASINIPSIGPSKALGLIKRYGTIENVLASSPVYTERLGGEEAAEAWLETVRAARKVFEEDPPFDPEWDLEGGEVEQEKLEKWLDEEWGIRLKKDVLSDEDVAVGRFESESESESDSRYDWEAEKAVKAHFELQAGSV